MHFVIMCKDKLEQKNCNLQSSLALPLLGPELWNIKSLVVCREEP